MLLKQSVILHEVEGFGNHGNVQLLQGRLYILFYTTAFLPKVNQSILKELLLGDWHDKFTNFVKL